MTHHPEQQQDEKYLGNTSISKFPDSYLKPLKTLRLGQKVFDINGKPLGNDYPDIAPLFVHTSEYDMYNTIMQNELEKIRRS